MEGSPILVLEGIEMADFGPFSIRQRRYLWPNRFSPDDSWTYREHTDSGLRFEVNEPRQAKTESACGRPIGRLNRTAARVWTTW